MTRTFTLKMPSFRLPAIRLTAIVAILSIALTGLTAAPATAMTESEQRTLALILGVTAFGLVLKEINDNKRKRRRAQEVAPDRERDPRWDNRDGSRTERGDHRWDDEQSDRRRDGRDGRPGATAHVIPTECVQEVRTSRRLSQVVSQSCINRSGAATQLPDACAIDIRDDNRNRPVYGLNCLLDRGFRVGDLRSR